MNDKELSIKIKQGANYLGLNLNDQQINLLIKYLSLLFKWNKTFSLTSITNLEDALNVHIMDGLSMVGYLKNTIPLEQLSNLRVLDVGSGMGVPGIIMAICIPEAKVDLIDSNHKKCAFLQQCKIELGLSSTIVVIKRVESYTPEFKYNLIISRAFADSALFVKLTQHLLDYSIINSCFITMKSVGVFKELEELKQLNFLIDNNIVRCNPQLIKLDMPDSSAERFLLKIKIL